MGIRKPKWKYVGTTYDVHLKDTRKGKGGSTSMTFLGKSVKDVKGQAKKVYKPFMKITKVKKFSRNYREK